MLTKLRLQNFRRFSDHTVPFEDRTLLVGSNNAGKSTAIEALRLVSLVTNRTGGLNFRAPPDWLDGEKGSGWGVSPSLRGFEFRLARDIFHRYGDPPARLTATFADGLTISVFIGPNEEVFAVLRGPDGDTVRSRRELAKLHVPRLGVQPQVGPVEPDERLLKERTVRAGLDSSLTPRHFRSQLVFMGDLFEEFRELASETWPGLRIEPFDWEEATSEGRPLSLLVRVDDFVGEISLMGHGLQMWLQLMWFLVRAKDDEIVVLDEPDVFMHPDLQRRLVRYLRRRHQQVVIATHSIEMLSDVEPSEVVSIETRRGNARRSQTLGDLQRIVEEIGGVHNLHLARMQRSGRFLFVEGDDLDLLDKIDAQLNPESLEPLSSLPNGSSGGWDNWPNVVGASRMLREQFGDKFRIYALFDSDYRWPAQLEERRRAASKERIELHIWSRKELENYLLVPTAIARVIEVRAKKSPTAREVEAEMKKRAAQMRSDVVGCYEDELAKLEPGLQPSTLHKQAAHHLDKTWRTFPGKVACVPGKKMRSALSAWSSKTYGASFGGAALAAHLHPDEVPGELRAVLDAIAVSEPFPS